MKSSITFTIIIFYQLNQLGSKAASDSTLKQLTLAGYQILVLYFTFYYLSILTAFYPLHLPLRNYSFVY